MSKENIKWNININQKAIIDNNLNIDLIDAAIYEFICSFIFSEKSEKIKKDNEFYYWISYQYIINSLPLLRITNREVIARRLQKLENEKLLNKLYNKKKNKTYFKLGKKYEQLVSNYYTQKSRGVDSEVERGRLKSRGGSTQKSRGVDSKVERGRLKSRRGSTQKSKGVDSKVEQFLY